MVGIYRNSMETTAQRSQLVKLSGAQLHPRRLRPRAADRRRQADQRMLLPDAGDRPRPRDRRHRAPAQRHPEAAPAQGLPRRWSCGPAAAPSTSLPVYPLQRKVQLRKNLRGGTSNTWRSTRTSPPSRASTKPTRCGCSAFNVTSGPEKGQARLLAYVGGELVAEATDAAAGELTGRAAAASRSARPRTPSGVVASVDDVVVRVPSPF